MRTTHLRQADLNLLVVFAAVAEERNITRAASRLLLSQPAVSRALIRLRDMFHDDLLIRTRNGYEPTPKGQRLLHELETVLPRLDRFMAGGEFDPAGEEVTFRIAATDLAASVLAPQLAKSVLSKPTKVSFDFVPFHAGVYEELDKGKLDLVFNVDDSNAPAHFSKEVFLEPDPGLVCVVSRKSRFTRAITLKQYLAAEHVAIHIIGGIQSPLEKRLAEMGKKRRCPCVVSHHTVAIRVAAATDLIATVPSTMAVVECSNKAIRILKAPSVLGRMKLLMTWHPRMQTDAAHVWLRSTVRELAKQLS
ncbi:MAG TPA: LysR family transcriptional regulator [Candidatus Acidoferrum sp.]